MAEYTANNCHGCKWLDEVQKGRAGEGYCCMVENSNVYKMYRKQILSLPYFSPKRIEMERESPKVRRVDSQRCELYEAGKFADRFDKYRPPALE